MTDSSQYLISRLEAVDWDFVARSARKSPFTTFHWYPGQLISQIPATLIGLLTNPGDTVVDPFAGSGSVVTEAHRLDRLAIAIDINPIALQIIAAKSLKLSAQEIRRITNELVVEVGSFMGHDLISRSLSESVPNPPPTVQLSKWYSAQVGTDLCRLWNYCGSQEGNRRIICDAAFSSILKQACRETRSWGYVCDNVDPDSNKKRKFAKESPDDSGFNARIDEPLSNEIQRVKERSKDVLMLLAACLKKLNNGYEEQEKSRGTSESKLATQMRVTCIRESSITALERVNTASVSLVLTSPPYFGVHDYAKSQRLSMEWLGYDIAQIRDQEIGARSKRARRSAANDYLEEMTEVFGAAHRVLKPGGWLAMIVGESEIKSREGIVSRLQQSIEKMGFSHTFDKKRQIGKERAQAPKVQTEQVLVWRK